MNIENFLMELDNLIEKSWTLPLSGGKTVMDADKAREIIDSIRLQLPNEIQQARAVVADRTKIINDAKKEAETIIRIAEERAKAMVDENRITQEAKTNANDMLDKALANSKEMRTAASEYVDDLMRRTDESIMSSLSEIRKARQSIKESRNKK